MLFDKTVENFCPGNDPKECSGEYGSPSNGYFFSGSGPNTDTSKVNSALKEIGERGIRTLGTLSSTHP